MVDSLPEILTEINAFRLSGLDLGEEFVYPNYAGRSILNLPSSLCHWLGVDDIGTQGLDPRYLQSIGSRYRHIVLVLLDALSFSRLKAWIASGLLPTWRRLAEVGVLAPLTSITPSTTSAALTALWTGRGTIEHGITGYELWLKEYGVVANTILHAPMSFQGDTGSLKKAGFTPETFLNLPTLGDHLARFGVHTYAFQHKSIARSGLSRMLLGESRVNAYATPTDLWADVRDLLERKHAEINYLWVYWGELDYFSHHFGPDDERTLGEFISFTHAFEHFFFDRLSKPARQDTLFVLAADHGQIATQPDPYYDLRNHPGLTRRLHILPTGENRLAYLYIRPGQTEAVREYIQRNWPQQFVFLEPEYAVRQGLFGKGKPHPMLFDRLGDLLVVARGNAYLWWSNKKDHLMGRHGGLSSNEMLVPFLACELA